MSTRFEKWQSDILEKKFQESGMELLDPDMRKELARLTGLSETQKWWSYYRTQARVSKPRNSFTEGDKKILEAYYQDDPWLQRGRAGSIAKSLNRSAGVIRDWFYCRRLKDKSESGDQSNTAEAAESDEQELRGPEEELNESEGGRGEDLQEALPLSIPPQPFSFPPVLGSTQASANVPQSSANSLFRSTFTAAQDYRMPAPSNPPSINAPSASYGSAPTTTSSHRPPPTFRAPDESIDFPAPSASMPRTALPFPGDQNYGMPPPSNPPSINTPSASYGSAPTTNSSRRPPPNFRAPSASMPRTALPFPGDQNYGMPAPPNAPPINAPPASYGSAPTTNTPLRLAPNILDECTGGFSAPSASMPQPPTNMVPQTTFPAPQDPDMLPSAYPTILNAWPTIYAFNPATATDHRPAPNVGDGPTANIVTSYPRCYNCKHFYHDVCGPTRPCEPCKKDGRGCSFDIDNYQIQILGDKS